jgi:hypothetical protein
VGVADTLGLNQRLALQHQMILTKTSKSHYSEAEAAAELGVSVDELRSLLKTRIVEKEEDQSNVPSVTYQPSDLVLLRFLVAQRQVPTPV